MLAEYVHIQIEYYFLFRDALNNSMKFSSLLYVFFFIHFTFPITTLTKMFRTLYILMKGPSFVDYVSESYLSFFWCVCYNSMASRTSWIVVNILWLTVHIVICLILTIIYFLPQKLPYFKYWVAAYFNTRCGSFFKLCTSQASFQMWCLPATINYFRLFQNIFSVVGLF